MTHTIPRYPPTYREDEICLILDAARQGQSLCFVGIAGIGKSNITNFLRHDPYQYKQQYLGKDTAQFLFPVIEGNGWNQTPQHLWELMLADLSELTRDLPQPPADTKMLQLSEEQRTFSALRERVQWVTKDHQVMFILDDFDKVLQAGPLSMLEQLSALRNAGNRDKLSYLLFTKKLPHLLGKAHPLLNNSKFYDLFKDFIYALKPYTYQDAQQMLLFLNENADKPLHLKDLPLIREKLTGGHAGLIKIVFDSWRRTAPEADDLVTFFAEKPEVRNECQRIYQGLHRHEQQVARRVAHYEQTAEDQAVIDHLCRRGLLLNATSGEWFSPLLASFLRSDATQGETNNG